MPYFERACICGAVWRGDLPLPHEPMARAWTKAHGPDAANGPHAPCTVKVANRKRREAERREAELSRERRG